MTKFAKWLPMFMTILGVVVAEVDGDVMAWISAHPSSAILAMAAWATFKHLLTSPVAQPPAASEDK
jgi:hypothetical protein